MKTGNRIAALFLAVLLLLLCGCSREIPQASVESPIPMGDVDVAVQYLPEKVENPEGLPVLKWLCMTDFTQGGGKGRVWNEAAVHQLNEMLAQRGMPYRVQFIMLTANSLPDHFEWLEQKEVKKLIKNVDLIFGNLSAEETMHYLMPITQYAAGQAQPSLENTVPYAECWNSTTLAGQIYGIRAVQPIAPDAIGWHVDKKVIDEYGFTVEDFAGKYYWEMDDVFAKLYEKNGNHGFLCEGYGGTTESVVSKEDSAKYFVPGAISPLVNGRFLSIGAFYALDFGLETPQVVNLLETEYMRGYQEAIIRYSDIGYVTRKPAEELVIYGRLGTGLASEDEQFYYIPVEPTYLSNGKGGTVSGISATAKHPEEALSLLALIGDDEEFRMQLAYGREGQDYIISEEGYYELAFGPNGTTYSLDFLFCLNYFSGLTSHFRESYDLYSPSTRHNGDKVPEGMTLLQTYQALMENCTLQYPYSTTPLPEEDESGVLSFHFGSLQQELEDIKEVSDYYFSFYTNPADTESKPRMSKEKYDEMLQALRDAGSDKILAELQRQLDEWLVENPDWNK